MISKEFIINEFADGIPVSDIVKRVRASSKEAVLLGYRERPLSKKEALESVREAIREYVNSVRGV